MLLRVLACMSGLALMPPGLAGDVYRCQDGDSTVFSDRPCGADARRVNGATISIIEPAGDLSQIAEENRRFIEQRRARLSLRSERWITPAPSQSTPVVQPSLVVFALPWTPYHDWPEQRRSARLPPKLRQQDYSALNGPILGTRRGPNSPYGERRTGP